MESVFFRLILQHNNFKVRILKEMSLSPCDLVDFVSIAWKTQDRNYSNELDVKGRFGENSCDVGFRLEPIQRVECYVFSFVEPLNHALKQLILFTMDWT